MFTWVAKISCLSILAGLSIGGAFLKIYLLRLESLLIFLKTSKPVFWRALGSPDLPLSMGFSSSASGRKVMRYIFRGGEEEKTDPELLRLRVGTRNTFLLFAAGVVMVFFGFAAIPISVAILSAM